MSATKGLGIEKARQDLQLTADACRGAKEMNFNDISEHIAEIDIILDALTAAERERNIWRESAHAADAVLFKTCKERDEARAWIAEAVDWMEAYAEIMHHSRDGWEQKSAVRIDALLVEVERPENYRFYINGNASIAAIIELAAIKTLVHAAYIPGWKKKVVNNFGVAYHRKLKEAGK